MPAVESPPSRKPRTRPSKPLKLDHQKVKELHAKGLNTVEIARHQGVRPSTVWRFLERTKPEREALAKFKANRSDVFADLQGKAISAQHLVIDSIMEDLERGYYLDANGIRRALTPSEKARIADAMNNVQGTIYNCTRSSPPYPRLSGPFPPITALRSGHPAPKVRHLS